MARQSEVAELVGLFYGMEIAVDVVESDGGLTAAIVGVPAGLEARLEPTGVDTFVMAGGALPGAQTTFTRDVTGAVTGMSFGPFQFQRIAQADLGELPLVERLTAPELEMTAEKEAAFEALLDQALRQGGDEYVPYGLPFPLWEFVRFLIDQDTYIFHSSGRTDLTELRPERQSMELSDETGRGNMAAVYGTHDGLWSMFFAVIDRDNLRGSIRNGVLTFLDTDGVEVPVYNFSINRDELDKRPYRSGALYLLPRESFVRLELLPGVLSNEWASEQPVRPLAKLAVAPKDFPFLDQIGGHDDGPLLRFGELGDRIREAATGASLNDGSLTIQLPNSSDMQSVVEAYLALLGDTLPVAVASTHSSHDELVLTVANLPTAVQQMVAAQYADLLTQRDDESHAQG